MFNSQFSVELLLANQLKKNLPRLIKKSFVYYKQIHLITTRSNLLALLLFSKNHSLCLYKNLVDITVYDTPGKNYRFCVIYSLKSYLYNTRLFIYTYTNESIWIPSVTTLYKSANWQEREVFDLFGIYFKNHPDLRRILTDYGFSGFPFRKDFPVLGFLEYYYDERAKLICSQFVETAAEFRMFNTAKTW